MTHSELVSRLSRLIDDPDSDFLYAITMQQVIQQIAHRMKEDALSLTAEQLELARGEFQAALDHYLDVRPIYEIAIENWLIVKDL